MVITTPIDGALSLVRLPDGSMKISCHGPRGGFKWYFILSKANEQEMVTAIQDNS